MAQNVRLDITGEKQVVSYLQGLSGRAVNRVFRSSFRGAARPLIRKIKSNLTGHRRTGELSRSIGARRITRRFGFGGVANADEQLTVGARTSGNFRGYHGYIINNGTIERRHRDGTPTGKVQGTGFFDDAVNSEFPNLQRDLSRDFNNLLRSNIARLQR